MQRNRNVYKLCAIDSICVHNSCVCITKPAIKCYCCQSNNYRLHSINIECVEIHIHIITQIAITKAFSIFHRIFQLSLNKRLMKSDILGMHCIKWISVLLNIRNLYAVIFVRRETSKRTTFLFKCKHTNANKLNVLNLSDRSRPCVGYRWLISGSSENCACAFISMCLAHIEWTSAWKNKMTDKFRYDELIR